MSERALPPNRMVWVDVETTGLDPLACSLLEVAMIITDTELREVAHTSALFPWHGKLEEVDPIVRDMHEKSGLWRDLADAMGTGTVKRRYEVESTLVDFLHEHEATKSPMCGSTVSFDRGFLKEHLPKVEALFHYRHVDVSTIDILAELWNPEVFAGRPTGSKAHRAMADIQSSIERLRYYRHGALI